MPEVSRESISSLASKLDSFAEALSEDERSVLGGIIARAEAASEAEVEGYTFSQRSIDFGRVQKVGALESGLSSQLAKSVGGPDIGDMASLTVSWGW